MSPFSEACDQMSDDLLYQAFVDFSRKTDLDVQLWQITQLKDGRTDPAYVPHHIQKLYWGVVKNENAPVQWSKALELIAQVQREKEQV